MLQNSKHFVRLTFEGEPAHFRANDIKVFYPQDGKTVLWIDGDRVEVAEDFIEVKRMIEDALNK